MTETIGVAAALFPAAWLTLFDQRSGDDRGGLAYLRMVGPFYGFFGLGMSLYFASQGAGALKWPLLAGLLAAWSSRSAAAGCCCSWTGSLDAGVRGAGRGAGGVRHR